MDNHEQAAAKAEVFRALAHPVRLQVAQLLHQHGPLCVCRLNEFLPIEQSTLSRHLLQMKAAGVVDSRREGTMTIYHLVIPCLAQFLSCVQRVVAGHIAAQRQALDRLMGERT